MKKRDQLEKLQVLLADVYKESILEMRDTGEYNAALRQFIRPGKNRRLPST